jgi:peptide chain release factor subunit 1
MKCTASLSWTYSEASIGILNGTRIQVLYNMTPPIPNKHNHGGQSSLRFSVLEIDAINEYYKKLGDK